MCTIHGDINIADNMLMGILTFSVLALILSDL